MLKSLGCGVGRGPRTVRRGRCLVSLVGGSGAIEQDKADGADQTATERVRRARAQAATRAARSGLALMRK